jgi:hypothetical protein
MSTHDLYTKPLDAEWSIQATANVRFSWEYEDGRDKLLALYQKGKDKQWDAEKRIDWSLDVDPYDPLGVSDQSITIYGTKYWDRMSEEQKAEARRHSAAWQFSQFLHGEQGALICASKIVESVPDMDAKFYGSTQVIDEARHVEVFGRFLQTKIGLAYPLNDQLQRLLENTITDSRWDMPYLGMQVLIEGIALAAFGTLRDIATKPLPKRLLAYVMQDEARHVAFGRLALRDYYRNLSEPELREREEFIIEGCYLLRDRMRGFEIWENFGIAPQEITEVVRQSEFLRRFHSLLFSRIVPCVRDIGLWSERVQEAYQDLGVIHMARNDLEELMRSDEEIAEKLDLERFAAEESARRSEVHEVIASANEDT